MFDVLASAPLRLMVLLQSQRGQTLAEYGLIVTTIAVGVTVTAMIVFRAELVSAFNSASSCLNGTC